MLTINKTVEGKKVTFALAGRLDNTGAPQLESELKRALERTTELVFDLRELEYVSSAGLRVLLLAQKQMNLQGRMRLENVPESVFEILEITGFTDIFFIVEG